MAEIDAAADGAGVDKGVEKRTWGAFSFEQAMNKENSNNPDPEDDLLLEAPDDYEDDEEGTQRQVFELSDEPQSLEDLIRRAARSEERKGKKPKAQASSTAEPAAAAASQPRTDGEARNGGAAVVLDGVVEDETTQLRAQVEQERNNTLRALADLQNFRRRVDDERKRYYTEANERLLKEILPINDDFERSLAAAQEAQSYDLLIEGVDAVYRKMNDVFSKQGVEPIPTVGERFDPDLHEAVSIMEDSDQPDETVVQELRKGYKLHGRVIRPALVVVAKAGVS